MKNLTVLVKQLSSTNSTNEKKAILAQYPECMDLLAWIYSPLSQFNITSTNVKKIKIDDHPDAIQCRTIFDLLKALSSRQVTGHAAIVTVKKFITANSSYEDLVYRIIDKDLKVRIDAKIINAVFPGLIPTFDVALANKYSDYKDKINFSSQNWYCSRKLDGVRVITIIDDLGIIRFFSRQGKEFYTLDVLRDELKYLRAGTVLDGEVCIIDENGNEDFSSIVKLIRRKDFTIPNPKYKIFDILFLATFNERKGGPIFSERQEHLKILIKPNPYIEIIEQKKIFSHEELNGLLQQAVEKGWEGLIIRQDLYYEGKRSNNMLKVKAFTDAEFIVTGIETGVIRFIENGTEKSEEMLSAVLIQYKNCTVAVGSGFSIEQRRKYYKHPEEIIGKTITVKYFSESRNEHGGYSLRFPILKTIYENGRDV